MFKFIGNCWENRDLLLLVQKAESVFLFPTAVVELLLVDNPATNKCSSTGCDLCGQTQIFSTSF